MAHGEEPAPAPVLVPAALAKVKQVPYTYYQVAIGQIEARQQVLLSAEVSGQVVALAFDSGDQVKAGNVVVRLNTSPEEGELTRLRGEFEAAKTHYGRLQALARNGAESQRALDSARAQFDAAKGNLENIQAQIAQKTIRAPFSGELGIRQVHLGTTCRPVGHWPRSPTSMACGSTSPFPSVTAPTSSRARPWSWLSMHGVA